MVTEGKKTNACFLEAQDMPISWKAALIPSWSLVDSNYTTDRKITEYQQPWNRVSLMTLWGTNHSKNIATISNMFLTFLWAQQWYNIIPGSLSTLRVTPTGAKGDLRDNISLSLLEIRTPPNFTPSHPELGLSSTKSMGPVSKVPIDKKSWAQ